MSKITAIVISYNEKGFIRRAIESVVSQITDSIEIEILIADDGSYDGSVELIEQIEVEMSSDNISIDHFVMPRQDNNHKCIPSLRVSNLVKHALSIASGDYCVILSADDSFCDNTKFSTAMKFLDEHSDYYSYVTGFRYADNKKESIPDFSSSFMFWAHMDFFHISCFIFRMTDPRFLLDRFCDDTGMVYSILKSGKCKADNMISFEYFQRVDSIQNSAAKIELLITEAMIVQDILNDKQPRFGFKFATKSREFAFIKELYSCRNQLKDERYSHLLSNCRKYKNDIVGRIADYKSFSNRLWFCFFYSGVAFDHYYISMLWRLIRLFRKKR